VEGGWFIWVFWIFLAEVTSERKPRWKRIRRASCPSAMLKDNMSFSVLPLCPHDAGSTPAGDLLCSGKRGKRFALLSGYPEHSAGLRG